MSRSGEPTISVCTIVKNEALRLRDFFEDVLPNADEVIVVDTGSTDGSVDIVEKYLSRFPQKLKFKKIVAPIPFHYGRVKNESLKLATQDYIFVLDADELPEQGFFVKLKEFLQNNSPEIVTVRRQDELLPHFIDRQTRIFKRGSTRYNDFDHIHEQLQGAEKAVAFDGILIHRQAERHWLNNSEKFYSQLEGDVAWTPKTKSFFGHLLRGFWLFQYKFRKYVFSYKLYKDGWAGLKYSLLMGLYGFLLQYRIGLKPDPTPDVNTNNSNRKC